MAQAAETVQSHRDTLGAYLEYVRETEAQMETAARTARSSGPTPLRKPSSMCCA